MHPEEIKAALRMQGITPAALADDMGVANSSVSQVISGRATSARISARIAKIIGKPVAEIWPPKNNPLVRRRVKPATARAAA